uniref:Uncharacterized protein n=1 Tax=Siphoviridae sp. ct96x5 TaxID=2825367 RepID=A0A8S5PST4_9CAUD|nr:MAG TPA: hypothetical protein [Siphoviridae sp. ct96x5]
MLEKMKNNPSPAKVPKSGVYIVYIVPYIGYTHCIACFWLCALCMWACVCACLYRRGQNTINC